MNPMISSFSNNDSGKMSSSEDDKIDLLDTPKKIRKQYQYFTKASLQKLRKVGYQGFLIGENFMKSNNPMEAAHIFIKQVENEI